MTQFLHSHKCRFARTFYFSFQLAVSNALRYFPQRFHSELATEFAQELKEYGHIYMYRMMPTVELK